MFGQEKPKEKKPAQPDMVKRLQDYGRKQMEENRRKEEEKKKKKKEGVDTSPTPGIMGRLYDFYKGMTGKKKEGEKK